MTRVEYISHLIEIFGEDFSNQNRVEIENVKTDHIGVRVTVNGYRIKLYSGGILTEELNRTSDIEQYNSFVNLVQNSNFIGELKPIEAAATFLPIYPISGQMPVEKESILDYIEEFISFHIEAGIQKQYAKRSQKYSFNSETQNVGNTVAKIINYSIQINASEMVGRGSTLFDKVDKLITVGKSENWTEDNSYREHVVPCDLIIENAFIMFENGSSIEEVSVMINQNLFIVLITPQEANILDSELGMKTTMPEGWEFGDNVFARLDTAGIKYKNFK